MRINLSFSNNRGYSLIELIIVMIIITIISSFALINSNSVVKTSQLNLMADEMENVIHFARMMCIASDKQLVLKPLADDNEWATGMILFKDNRDHTYKSNEQLIHQWQWKKRDTHILWHGFFSSAYLLFSPSLKHSALSGSFQIFSNEKKKLTLYLNRLGHIRRSENT